MSQTSYLVAQGTGYLVAAAGLWGVVFLCLPRNWPYFHKGCLFLTLGSGALLAFFVTLRYYHWSPKLVAWGFPFAAAFFEQQENGDWYDFVGPMTGIHFLLNIFVAFGLPHLLLALYVFWKKKRSPQVKPSG